MIFPLLQKELSIDDYVDRDEECRFSTLLADTQSPPRSPPASPPFPRFCRRRPLLLRGSCCGPRSEQRADGED